MRVQKAASASIGLHKQKLNFNKKTAPNNVSSFKAGYKNTKLYSSVLGGHMAYASFLNSSLLLGEGSINSIFVNGIVTAACGAALGFLLDRFSKPKKDVHEDTKNNTAVSQANQ